MTCAQSAGPSAAAPNKAATCGLFGVGSSPALAVLTGKIDSRGVARFMAKFAIHPETGCWNWTGTNRGKGYGALMLLGVNEYAHRASWLIHRGEIPASAMVLHRCDNRRCVNPEHLFLGDAKANWHDMKSKGRHTFGERVATHRLTEADVRGIKVRLAQGETAASIARSLPVSSSTIRQIQHGKRWAHV